jgi:hypothetical protein
MTKNNKKNNRSTSRRSQSVPSNQILSQVLRSLKLQQTSGEPDTPDIVLPPFSRDQIYEFRESYVQAIVASATVETDIAINFKLSQLPNNGSVGTMFDQYRFMNVRCEFQPTSVSNSGPPIYTVIDYDDSNNITANTALAYDTCKTSPPGAFFERCFTPRVNLATQTATSGTYTAAAAFAHQWVDVASFDVAHYGIKICIPSGTANTWSLRATITYQCRNTR